MNRAKIYLTLFSLLLAALWLLPEVMRAQTLNQAALVIRYSDEQSESVCIEFEEPEITGLEAMQLANLELEYEVQGLGAVVCSIEQTGCPADDCWCQCKGGSECIYWSYWQQREGSWSYAQGGASLATIADGEVQGWSWGPGTANQAIAPPVMTLADVCTDGVSEVLTTTATATATATAVVFVPQQSATPGSPADQAGATLTATSTMTPRATASPTVPLQATLAATATETFTPLPVGTGAIASASPVLSTAVSAEPVTSLAAVAAASEPSATPQPTATTQSDTSAQIQVTAVAVALEIETPLNSRQPQQDAKRPQRAQPAATEVLAVVGAQIDLPPRNLQPETAASSPVAEESLDAPDSPYSYGLFMLIVLFLLGLLLLTNLRHRHDVYDA